MRCCFPLAWAPPPAPAASPAGAALIPAPTAAAQPTEAPPAGPVLDFDGSDGYSGDYVLILNTNSGGRTLSTGVLEGLIETDVPRFTLTEATEAQLKLIHSEPYANKALNSPDPYAERLPADDKYDCTVSDEWQPGFIKGFYLYPDYSQRRLVAFRVLHVGGHCRIWTAVNPDFIPLDAIGDSCAQLYGEEFDAHYDRMTRVFGAPADPRGDGKVNILFYNIPGPMASGFTNPGDLYPTFTYGRTEQKGNSLPMISIDTLGYHSAIQLDENGELIPNPQALLDVIVHEFQHLLFASEDYRLATHTDPSAEENGAVVSFTNDDIWMTEFHSAAAAVLCYPDSTAQKYIPLWYDANAKYADWEENVLHNGSREFQPNSQYPIQTGKGFFDWSNKMDSYATMVFLSLFCLERGGEKALVEINRLWRENNSDDFKPINAVYEALGYEDFSGFFTDFALSLTLNQGDYTICSTGELDNLRPIVTVGREVKMSPGSFILIKPTSGAYTPPVTAMEGLSYIGISVGE